MLTCALALCAVVAVAVAVVPRAVAHVYAREAAASHGGRGWKTSSPARASACRSVSHRRKPGKASKRCRLRRSLRRGSKQRARRTAENRKQQPLPAGGTSVVEVFGSGVSATGLGGPPIIGLGGGIESTSVGPPIEETKTPMEAALSVEESKLPVEPPPVDEMDPVEPLPVEESKLPVEPPPVDETAPVEPPPPFRFFSATSFWNESLPSNAPLDGDSAAMVASFDQELTKEEEVKRGPANINTTAWSVPVYTVPAYEPAVRVVLEGASKTSTLQAAWEAVPLPANAQAAAGSDKHLLVWQPSTDKLWEFWGLLRVGETWHASWGGAIHAVSSASGA